MEEDYQPINTDDELEFDYQVQGSLNQALLSDNEDTASISFLTVFFTPK